MIDEIREDEAVREELIHTREAVRLLVTALRASPAVRSPGLGHPVHAALSRVERMLNDGDVYDEATP